MKELALVTAGLAPGDPRPKGDGVAIVHMSVGWWVAFCGRPFCTHAEWYGLSPAAGVGGLTATHMMCPACGWAGPAQWPAHWRGIEQILADRPDPSTRNWLPGETLGDLERENAEHGIVPAAALTAREAEAAGELPPGGVVLRTTAGDDVLGGARELAPGRLAIPGGP
jgi:hypothetical protein